MSTFLNSVVETEDKITISLRYAAEYDNELPYTKVTEVNKYYTYKVTHVKDGQLINDTGRIINVLYSNKQTPFVRDTIYDTTDLANKWPEGEKYLPSTITLDCSAQYTNKVINIDIANIRNIELIEKELVEVDPGDIVTITMLDGIVYEEIKIVRVFAAGNDTYILASDATIDDSKHLPIFDELLNTKDIANIEIISYAEAFEYKPGDMVKITYVAAKEDVEPAELYCKILSIIDPTNKITTSSIVGFIVSDINGEGLFVLYMDYITNIEKLEPSTEEPETPPTEEEQQPSEETPSSGETGEGSTDVVLPDDNIAEDNTNIPPVTTPEENTTEDNIPDGDGAIE